MERLNDTEDETTEEDYLSIPSEEIEIRDKNEEAQLLTISRKEQMTESEMEQFCNQLHDFIQQIQSLEQIKNIYKYSRDIGDKLEADINELQFLLLEVNSVLRDIQRMRYQRQSVRTETKNVRKMFAKTKQQELNEMELVIAVYDKDILRKWHTAKRSNNVNSLEAFVAEMNGKREATDYAIKMAKERLQNITSSQKSWGSTPLKNKVTNLSSAIPLDSPTKKNNIFSFI